MEVYQGEKALSMKDGISCVNGWSLAKAVVCIKSQDLMFEVSRRLYLWIGELIIGAIDLIKVKNVHLVDALKTKRIYPQGLEYWIHYCESTFALVWFGLVAVLSQMRSETKYNFKRSVKCITSVLQGTYLIKNITAFFNELDYRIFNEKSRSTELLCSI